MGSACQECCLSHRLYHFPGTLKCCFPGDGEHRHCNSDSCLFSSFDPFIYWSGEKSVNHSSALHCMSPTQKDLSVVWWKFLVTCCCGWLWNCLFNLLPLKLPFFLGKLILAWIIEHPISLKVISVPLRAMKTNHRLKKMSREKLQ